MLMMYQTSDNSQLREEYCESMHSWLLSEVWNIIAPNLSIFSTFWITKWSKEGTWFHSFEKSHSLNFCLKVTFTTHLGIELMIACCSKKIKYVAIFLVHLLHSKQEILWRLLSLTLMFQKQRVQPNLTYEPIATLKAHIPTPRYDLASTASFIIKWIFQRNLDFTIVVLFQGHTFLHKQELCGWDLVDHRCYLVHKLKVWKGKVAFIKL